MSAVVDDATIDRLIRESKGRLDPSQLTPTTGTSSNLRTEVSVSGSAGSRFKVLARRSTLDVNDFSIILGWERPEVTGIFRLLRCNGLSHRHRNKLEGDRFFAFHIHRATERYQLAGFDEDGFAEPATNYIDYGGAARHFAELCGFDPPEQQELPFS